MKIQRRRFLQATAACSGVPFLCGGINVFGQEPRKKPFKIGICDWDVYATGDPKSLAIARELGFDGVEVTFAPEGEFSLSKPENRKLFLETAQKESVEISSFAMGILNEVPLATVESVEGWIADCIEAMAEMKVKTVLLPFFFNGDIKDNVEGRNKVIEKFKRLAPLAEKKNVVLGIESFLGAREYLAMLEKIGNKAAMIYYDVTNMFFRENMTFAEYPIYDDLEMLLKEKVVCQIHCKENYAQLGQGKIDFRRVRDLLEKYDYQGWLVAETFPWTELTEAGHWKEFLKKDVAFLRKTFNESS